MRAGVARWFLHISKKEQSMTQPVFALLESLEMRTLLSAVTLSAGKTQLFDFNADGTNDAILVNTGTSDIQYEYSAGSTGLDAVLLTADGGKFTTNTYVTQVGDVSDTLDFSMGNTKIGVAVRYGKTNFAAIEGDTSVVEGSLSQLEIGKGDLLNVQATTGDIGKVYVNNGDLVNASAVGIIYSLIVEGDLLGSVYAGGSIIAGAGIGTISANHISAVYIDAGTGAIGKIAVDQIDNGTIINAVSMGTISVGTITGQSSITTQQNITKLQAGTISDASINVGGSIGSLIVDTISGSAASTSISILQHVGKFQAQLITGGDNGVLFLSFGAGVDSFTVGQMDGGTASDGNYSGAYISIVGDVAKLSAGLISGGWADGDFSTAVLSFTVDPYTDVDGNVLQLGDIVRMNVSVMSGGVGSNGADAMLFFTVAHDLINAQIGQMTGNGNVGSFFDPTKFGHGLGWSNQSGSNNGAGCDPSIYMSVYHDIVKMVVGQISGGNAIGESSDASVNIQAGNDIISLTAGQIDGGTAIGDYSWAVVNITAGHDIDSITANTFSGGSATGVSAMTGLTVEAGNDIGFIGANLIAGSLTRTPIQDPMVRFIAGGDIGTVLAGRITGGTVTSDGVSMAQASVLIQANGTYIDADGVQSEGNIGTIIAGTIDGGSANGADALSFVKIAAAHDINRIYSDQILGGQATNGGFAYVSITAGHDIGSIQAGLISGATGNHYSSDPAVLIQAYNDIKSLVADQIIAGINGSVSILAGLDASGNVSGELDAEGNLIAGSIENMIVGLISGNGGIVNIAAGGDIENLKVCRIISGNGDVNIVAGDDITANVGSIQSWNLAGETGVAFVAGGEVNDVRNSIKAQYTTEGVGQEVAIDSVEVPVLPEGV
jgi:hypothetical protein